MRIVAKVVRSDQQTPTRQQRDAARTVLGFSGALLSIVGIVLAVGGLMSISDGSPFYCLAGIGLAVSGALVAKRNRAGAWTYLAVFAATLSWSLRNVDQGPSIAHRLVGPVILLGIAAALMPSLLRWRPPQASIAFAFLALVTVGLGISSTAHGPLARQTAAVTQFLDSEAKGVFQ